MEGSSTALKKKLCVSVSLCTVKSNRRPSSFVFRPLTSHVVALNQSEGRLTSEALKPLSLPLHPNMQLKERRQQDEQREADSFHHIPFSTRKDITQFNVIRTGIESHQDIGKRVCRHMEYNTRKNASRTPVHPSHQQASHKGIRHLCRIHVNQGPGRMLPVRQYIHPISRPATKA